MLSSQLKSMRSETLAQSDAHVVWNNDPFMPQGPLDTRVDTSNNIEGTSTLMGTNCSEMNANVGESNVLSDDLFSIDISDLLR